MSRIFLTLSVISNAALAVAYVLGWAVRDVAVPGGTGVDLAAHFRCGMAALTLAMLVHAIVLTYFMGTGRWIEETTGAYKLGDDARQQNVRLKHRTLPGMVGCLVLLIVVGGFGAAADPAAAVDWPAARTIHMILASAAIIANLALSVREYEAVRRNAVLINEIMGQVQTLRQQRGLNGTSAGASGIVDTPRS